MKLLNETDQKKKKVKQEEKDVRKLSGRIAGAVGLIAILTSLFHVYMNSASLMILIKKNAIHLGLMLALTFLMYPATKKSNMKDLQRWIGF